MQRIVPVFASGLILALLLFGGCRECESKVDIGVQIAGTWLGSYEFGDAEKTRAAFVTTYHADGTAFTTSARAWGAGDPERHGLSSLHHIQWEQSGEREIRWRLLHFGHEIDGRMRYVSRTHGRVEFDESFQRGTVSFKVEVFQPDALLDPLDPNDTAAQPFFTADGKSEIRRLLVGKPLETQRSSSPADRSRHTG